MMEHVNVEHSRILTLSFLPWGCCNSFLGCFRHLLHIILTHPKLIMHFICTYDSYHLSFTFLKVSWFEKPMDTEKGSGHHYFDPGYWEEFLVSHVISSQLALTRWRHGGSALWDKNWCKVSSKLKIFHHIFIKASNYSGDNGVNTLHRYHATFMIPEVNKQIRSSQSIPTSSVSSHPPLQDTIYITYGDLCGNKSTFL